MSFLSQSILLPPHLEYLAVDRYFKIIDLSLGVSRFVDFCTKVEIGQDIREHFPELIGCEPVLRKVLAEEKQNFQLTKIHRFLKQKQSSYINLYISSYQEKNKDEKCLLIFVEDFTESISIEQKLRQINNENDLLLKALKSSENYITKVVTSMADALIVTDLEGKIKTINQKTEDLFGYSELELIEQSIEKLINDPTFLPAQKYLVEQGKGEFQNREIPCQTKAEGNKTIAFSCSVIKIDKDKSYNFIYIGRDVTKSTQLEKRQQVLFYVTKTISESDNFARAIPKILRDICEHLNWDVGELWTSAEIGKSKQEPNLGENLKLEQNIQQKSVLRCTEIWSKKSLLRSEFRTITKRVSYELGEGLAGRVWQKGEAEWIGKISEQDPSLRKRIAFKEGLQGAFGFPIKSESQILGVMIFFSREIQNSDENLVKLMTTIGNQIGEFINRKKAEEALIREQEKTESLLLNILPKSIAQQLKQQTSTIANSFDSVTVLFADLVGFTELSSQLSPIEVVEMLNTIFSDFDRLSEKHRLEKIKTIGDAYMVVGGLPHPSPNSAEAIAEMALDMQLTIANFNVDRHKDLKIRIGINTGPVVAGVIGTKKFIYDLWGDTVNTASRMESHGIPNKIQVTETTYQRLKDRYQFKKRGPIYIKGKGTMPTYILLGRKE
ncbi:MAG: adenylate/guanylate cyclase domain-containing protein [Prochloraceae cyanobacterium]|nr:adenylate/guanylate cyclase domain-containing protein [Prochloraceae cyanobacterium]